MKLLPLFLLSFLLCCSDPFHINTRQEPPPIKDTPPTALYLESSNEPCVFNRDCPFHERCQCRGECFCRVGIRGSGVVGVTSCTNSDDCESSLCIEGIGGNFCSGPCMEDSECGGMFPVCSIRGEICVIR